MLPAGEHSCPRYVHGLYLIYWTRLIPSSRHRSWLLPAVRLALHFPGHLDGRAAVRVYRAINNPV